MKLNQTQKLFFTGDGPSHEEKLSKVGLGKNSDSPFNTFIGNEKALFKLKTAAFWALSKPNHLNRDMNYAILGPSSSGKTSLVRIYAETIGLPLVEINPKSIVSLKDLFEEIRQTLANEGIALIETSPNNYTLPPIIIFIDEVHALVNKMVQGLLKGIERKDSILIIEDGTVINAFCATWFIATTESGKLFDAFRNRFSEVTLKYLNKKDVAKIVKLAHPDLPDEICSLISHYNSRIPRQALDFAVYARQIKEMMQSSWEDAVKLTAENEGIDQHGMKSIYLKILTALGKKPIAQNRIGLIVGVKNEEAERNIMPWLLSETDDQPALVEITGDGYTLTKDGISQLELRNIPIGE